MRAFLLLVAVASLIAQEVSVEDALRMAAAGRLPEAESTLSALSAKNPRDADLKYRLGVVLLKEKKLDDALKVLKQATQADPAFVFAWLALADVCLQRGDRAGATDSAKRAQSLAGQNTNAWKALAMLDQRIGDAIGQARALEALIRLAPADREYRIRFANLMLEHRNSEAAGAAADAALLRFPADPELLRMRGLAWYGVGRKGEALDSFLAAMDAAPRDEVVHASIETLLPDCGDRLPQVVERLRRFNELRPESPLGSFLLALAQPPGADNSILLERAILIAPEFWPAYFELHRVLREQGKRDEAIAALETTLRLNPNHEAAHFALAELYAEAGDRAKAQQQRLEHHRLRAAAAAEEQRRAAEAPRFAVKVQ